MIKNTLNIKLNQMLSCSPPYRRHVGGASADTWAELSQTRGRSFLLTEADFCLFFYGDALVQQLSDC